VKADPEFGALYKREFRAVFQATYLLSGRRELAEDATQEAFARALQRWPRLRGRPWAGGWVMTTAMNLTRRSLRKSRPAEEASRDLNDLDQDIDLWVAVRKLPPREGEALILHYRADLSTEQVAKLMGCAPSTVRAHLARGRSRLREWMGHVVEEGETDAFAIATDTELGP